jgi:hypothetical protein
MSMLAKTALRSKQFQNSPKVPSSRKYSQCERNATKLFKQKILAYFSPMIPTILNAVHGRPCKVHFVHSVMYKRPCSTHIKAC